MPQTNDAQRIAEYGDTVVAIDSQQAQPQPVGTYGAGNSFTPNSFANQEQGTSEQSTITSILGLAQSAPGIGSDAATAPAYNFTGQNTSTTTTSSGGNIIWLMVVVLAGAGYYWFKIRKK